MEALLIFAVLAVVVILWRTAHPVGFISNEFIGECALWVLISLFGSIVGDVGARLVKKKRS